MIHIDSISCRGKACTVDNCCTECIEWSEERCWDVAAYAAKLSSQHEKKKERKAKSSSSSSFSVFLPNMPVPLHQLVSTSGVISTSMSLTPVCLVTYAVAGLAALSPSAVTVVEHPQKWKRVTDPAEQAQCWESFQNCWTSGRSTPSMGKSSATQPLLVTPSVDPGSSPALALPVVVAMSSSSRASSHCSRQSPGPLPALPDTTHPSSVRTGVASSDSPDPARFSSV